MLSKELQNFVDRTSQDGGINTVTLSQGTLLTLHTEGSTFHVLFIDSEKGVVVIQDAARKHFSKPFPCLLHGSTAGGSLVKVGWICFGTRIRFEGLLGGLVITRPVKPLGIEFVNDEQMRGELQAAYDAYDALPVLTEEVIASRIRAIIDGFPEQFRNETTDIINEFCFEGQKIMLGFLAQANEAGKFGVGLAALQGQLGSRWSYQHPQIRGRMMGPSDVEQVKLLYEAVGLPVPG